MTKFEVQLNSPVSSPSPSPPELPSQLKRKTPAAKTETTKKQKPEANILCIEEGINDPYVYHPVSPNIATATSTSFCPVAVNVTVTATNREISFQIFY
jgi:hypothetical protein